MKKINGCISLISSRSLCIEACLSSLQKKYNYAYGYPIYVHYFDDVYDDTEFQDRIKDDIFDKIEFINVDYKVPDHIKEEELFHNRHDLWYVRNSFPSSRKGYLHMCHFVSNIFRYPNTKIHNHEYMMMVDDESMFTKEPPQNPFETIANQPTLLGAMKITDRNKKTPHQGNFDTTVDLWNFIQRYLQKFNISPKSEFLKNLLDDPQSDINFHLFPIADSYVMKLEMFETPEWNQWINAVNTHGGIYKYRWGDNDIYSLFHLIHYDHNIYDLKTVDNGYHNQGALRHIENYAPSVKN